MANKPADAANGKRRIRRPFTVISAVSLMLCVAVCGLWVAERVLRVPGWASPLRLQWGASVDTGYGFRLYAHEISCDNGCIYYVRSDPMILPSDRFVDRRTELLGIFFQWGSSPLVIHGTRYFDQQVLGIPLAWPSALLAMLPAMWLWVLWLTRRRDCAGLCPSCGYDLRATPEQCPECGAVPAR
jgi:hypothetical protein